jgi:hypothetical protein
MKFNLTKHRKYLLAGGLLLATATPSFALFGIGDIVFDPTSYASLVSQLTTLESQYNMLKNNVTHFSFKQQWHTTLNQLKNANVANMFGETAGVNIALNSNSPSATYLQGQTVGNSAQLSQLAMIEMSDSVSPDCLTAVGQYRAGRSQNGTATNSLTQQQFDTTSATNSEVQQLNLLNAAQAQQLTEMQSQAAMHVCLASQMTVANMQQRNAAAQDLNTAAAIQQQRSTNDTSAANEGSTWTTYLP